MREKGAEFRAERIRLFELGQVAATAMDNWGVVHGAQYVRLVFSNEPVERLAGLGERFRCSLL